MERERGGVRCEMVEVVGRLEIYSAAGDYLFPVL